MRGFHPQEHHYTIYPPLLRAMLESRFMRTFRAFGRTAEPAYRTIFSEWRICRRKAPADVVGKEFDF